MGPSHRAAQTPRLFSNAVSPGVGQGVGQRGGSREVQEVTSSGAFKLSNLDGGNRMGLAQTWFRKSKGLFNQG